MLLTHRFSLFLWRMCLKVVKRSRYYLLQYILSYKCCLLNYICRQKNYVDPWNSDTYRWRSSVNYKLGFRLARVMRVATKQWEILPWLRDFIRFSNWVIVKEPFSFSRIRSVYNIFVTDTFTYLSVNILSIVNMNVIGIEEKLFSNYHECRRCRRATWWAIWSLYFLSVVYHVYQNRMLIGLLV